MNREAELHYSNIPSIDISRCSLTKAHDHKKTFNCGELVPIYVDDLVPGTTVKMKMSEVVRMMTPIAPVMDNAFMDIMFFFVPYRLVWSHWVNFMGENDTAPWAQSTNYEIPQITCPSGGWAKGSLADHFGLPTNVIGNGWKCNALPFRSYCKIFNDWWRDENLVTPVYISTGDSDTTGKNKGQNYDPVTDTECGAAPLKAAKLHDLFTSALPQAQKGPSVSVPLGKEAPVKFGESYNPSGTNTNLKDKDVYVNNYDTTSQLYGITDASSPAIYMNNSSANSLYTDLSEAVGATVNQLRQAFAVQKFYERAARGGSRYIETIRSHFTVTSPDFRLQRSEYLGGKRVPINMNQVVQTDASGKSSYWDPDAGQSGEWVTDDKTPQGNLAAYSATADTDEDMFTYSTTEHGLIMGLAVIRTNHSYQQGLDRMWSKKSMFDFYWPELANLGEQAILNKEIYLQGTDADEEAFGYQEAWYEYRYKPDIITGELRSNYAQSLDIWHYGDDYASLPSLGSEWIQEPTENMARTLAVQDHDQFFGDFYFAPKYILPMPLYSVPGLIDHH